jgi:hypothetical protein
VTTVNSLINLGDLSKPMTALIEKISEAMGGLFKPIQVVRAPIIKSFPILASRSGRMPA